MSDENRIFQKIVRDPVCGMLVDTETTPYRTTFDGVNYSFCSENCLKKFRSDPARYEGLPIESTIP